jgi:hypothetical protein
MVWLTHIFKELFLVFLMNDIVLCIVKQFFYQNILMRSIVTEELTLLTGWLFRRFKYKLIL